MSRVHVEVEFLLVARALVIDISHEWASGGGLVSTFRHDEGDESAWSMDGVYCVIDEACGTEEFAAGLGADAEDIFAFYCCPARVVGDGVVDTGW